MFFWLFGIMCKQYHTWDLAHGETQTHSGNPSGFPWDCLDSNSVTDTEGIDSIMVVQLSVMV